MCETCFCHIWEATECNFEVSKRVPWSGISGRLNTGQHMLYFSIALKHKISKHAEPIQEDHFQEEHLDHLVIPEHCKGFHSERLRFSIVENFILRGLAGPTIQAPVPPVSPSRKRLS